MVHPPLPKSIHTIHDVCANRPAPPFRSLSFRNYRRRICNSTHVIDLGHISCTGQQEHYREWLLFRVLAQLAADWLLLPSELR